MPAVRPAPLIPSTGPCETVGAGGTVPVRGPWRLRTADPELVPLARTLHTLLAPHLGDRLLPFGQGGEVRGGEPAEALELTFALGDTSYGATPHGVSPAGLDTPADESYRLTVDGSGVHCHAATTQGLFRAGTTALQLLSTAGPEDADDSVLGHHVRTDAPHYAWRGLMVDPARGFLSPAELRRIIDLAALYKFNVLHLHLTDNEGWRLELPTLPELTADGSEHYTAREYTELQRYAAERFLTVVPEIDLPGHCGTLRAAVPGLPAAPCPPELSGRFPFVAPLDLQDERTHALVDTVFAQLSALTDGPWVHIGGDEAVGMTADSFAEAVRALRASVRAHGKRPLGWQESSRAGIGPEDLAQFWVDVPMMELPADQAALDARPELLALGQTMGFIEALRRFFASADEDLERILSGGGKVLLSPQSHLYLDRPYAPAIVPPQQAEDAARLGFPSYPARSVAYTAAWDPSAHGVPEESVAGVEATVFGESVRGLADLTFLLLPRLASVAETAWTGRAPQWEEYRERLAGHGRLWRERGLTHLEGTEIAWV
ncbi:family 20 glycosylhydrolase [Streptomyces sp. NPDC007088]|uniref:family 20 glycosylhydrolase n=1 Tax=Streptomyces sp. NPDC007088 TaxID=3364773 RepID=UPI00367BEFAC